MLEVCVICGERKKVPDRRLPMLNEACLEVMRKRREGERQTDLTREAQVRTWCEDKGTEWTKR
jgi:hypothetical protein